MSIYFEFKNNLSNIETPCLVSFSFLFFFFLFLPVCRLDASATGWYKPNQVSIKNRITHKQLNQKHYCWRIIQLKIDWRYYYKFSMIHQFMHIRTCVYWVLSQFHVFNQIINQFIWEGDRGHKREWDTACEPFDAFPSVQRALSHITSNQPHRTVSILISNMLMHINVYYVFINEIQITFV